MTRRRWIADEVSGDSAALVGEHAAHLARVLRAEAGQSFDIAIGGEVRLGVITSICEDRVEFALGEACKSWKAPAITLALAIFKFDRMEWALEKCTEIGVARIIPVMARRSEAHLVAAAAKRHERWLRIVRQAAEQSRRAAAPEVTAAVKLKDLAGVLPSDVGDSHRSRRGACRFRRRESAGGDSTVIFSVIIAIFCGTRTERWRGGARGRARRRMGRRGTRAGFTKRDGSRLHWAETILRAETAAIVASALAMDALR